MWLLAGLGNPGGEYARHRHNIGFMAIDAMADKAGFPPFRAKFQGLISEGKAEGEKLALLKPQTYMNLSGQSVAETARFYKIFPARIVVFHDELDLPPGEVRVKRGGGNAGHNGLSSIQDHLGTGEFWRVRIGIGHPGRKEMVTGHVLGNFAKDEAVWTEPLLKALAEHYKDIVTDGPETYGRHVKESFKSPGPSLRA